MHDAELEALVERINELVEEFDSHPDPEARERAFELLQHVDALHREGLTRVAGMLRAAGHGKLLERLATDEAVRMLLALYDLLPEGASQDRTHRTDPTEETDRTGNGRRRGFVPLDSIEIAGVTPEKSAAPEQPEPGTGPGRPEPEWIRLEEELALEDGEMRGLLAAGVAILAVRLDGELHAYRNACGNGVLPLDMGRLEDGVIHCPWHGCRYQASSGQRLDEEGADLEPMVVEGNEAGIRVRVDPTASSAGGRGDETRRPSP